MGIIFVWYAPTTPGPCPGGHTSASQSVQRSTWEGTGPAHRTAYLTASPVASGPTSSLSED